MRKYKAGRRIRSVAEFEKDDADVYIIKYGAGKECTTARGWIISWQYRYLSNMIRDGKVYEAKAVGGDGHEAD